MINLPSRDEMQCTIAKQERVQVATKNDPGPQSLITHLVTSSRKGEEKATNRTIHLGNQHDFSIPSDRRAPRLAGMLPSSQRHPQFTNPE